LTDLQRVAKEIKTVGLYDLVLQDVQQILDKTNVSEEEILSVLKTNPKILRDYKQVNLEYNLSNIHLKEIDLDKIDSNCKQKAALFNKNLQTLKSLEPYTLDFEQSSVLVIIFSIEFFVLFSVQYFIVLLNLKEWQLLIYSIFAGSAIIAWLYAKKERKKFEKNSKKFYLLYDETLEILKELEQSSCIKKENLIIKTSDEHI